MRDLEIFVLKKEIDRIKKRITEYTNDENVSENIISGIKELLIFMKKEEESFVPKLWG